MSPMPRIVIIVPAYNEAAFIADVLRQLNAKKIPYVVIDDGSTDTTYKIAQKHASHVLRHRVNLGKGAALRTGCEYAFSHLRADAVIFMDSDAQHDIDELDSFIREIRAGAPLVLGVRSFDTRMPLIRIVGNRLASVLVYLFFGSYVPDIPSGYKAMTKKTYRKLALTSRDYDIELEIAVKTARYRIPFATVSIETIYHANMNRGFQILDTIKMLFRLILWRFGV